MQDLLNKYRKWLDPLGILRVGLADCILQEQSAVVSIAERLLGHDLIVPPMPHNGFYARTKPLSEVFEMFEVAIGSGVVARLGLILRCLFDRADRGEPMLVVTAQFSEEAARMGHSTARKSLDPRYATLVGVDASEAMSALSWWTEVMEFPEEESFEVRNGIRYGLIFLLYHELAHILRRHFEGRERAELDLTPEGFNAVQRGMEWDADVWAFKNLLIYIENFVDLELRHGRELREAASSAEERKLAVLETILTRGRHTRCAFFGIFAVLSMMNPLRWTNLDLDEEHYFHPVSRIAFAVRTLDLEGFPSDGKTMFYAFKDLDRHIDIQNRLKELPFGDFLDGRKTELSWNWSDFFMMALGEWDLEVGTFLNDMRRMHNLNMSPYPFNVHRNGMEFTCESVQRLIAALNAALPFIDQTSSLLLTKEQFKREFNFGNC